MAGLERRRRRSHEHNWRLFRVFTRFYSPLITAAIIAILVLTTYPFAPKWTLSWVFVYLAVRQLRSWHLRKDGARGYTDEVQLLSSAALTVGITAFLWHLYHGTSYLRDVGGADSLWLLYLMPAITAARVGRTRWVVISAFVSGLIMTVMLVGTGASGGVGVELTVVVLRAGWISLLAFIVHGLLSFANTYSNSLRKFGELSTARRLLDRSDRSLRDKTKAMRIAAAFISRDLEYDEVAILIRDSGGSLSCFAVASQSGFKLGDLRTSADTTAFDVYSTGVARKYDDLRPLQDASQKLRPTWPPAVRSEIVAPVMIRGESVGVLSVGAKPRHFFADLDLEICRLHAALVGSVLEAQESFDSHKLIARSHESLARLSKSLTSRFLSRRDMQDVLGAIANAAREQLGADVVMIYELSTDAGVRFAAQAGDLRQPEQVHRDADRARSLVETLLAEPWPTEQFDAEIQHKPESGFAAREGVESRVILKLLFENEFVGLMFLNYRQPTRVDSLKDQCRWFSSLAALAIRREQERERELEARMTTLTSVLHSAVSGRLTAALQHLGPLRRSAPETLGSTIDTIEKMILESAERLSQIYGTTSALADNTLGGALHHVAQQIGGLHTVTVTCGAIPSVVGQSRSWVRSVWSLTYEAATNGAKWGATHIGIQAYSSAGVVVISVQDDGAGFDPGRAEKGYGLTVFRDLTRYLGGTFEIESSAKKGSTVTFRLPLGEGS